MSYAWTDDLGTGVKEIDDQHKELFSRFNAILDACKQQKGRQEIGQYLRFLEEYVVLHFAAEEKKMSESGYPEAADHKAQHREFMKQMEEIKKEYQQYGTGINVILTAIRVSGDWLVGHIRKTDKAMAAYLRGKVTA